MIWISGAWTNVVWKNILLYDYDPLSITYCLWERKQLLLFLTNHNIYYRLLWNIILCSVQQKYGANLAQVLSKHNGDTNLGYQENKPNLGNLSSCRVHFSKWSFCLFFSSTLYFGYFLFLIFFYHFWDCFDFEVVSSFELSDARAPISRFFCLSVCLYACHSCL